MDKPASEEYKHPEWIWYGESTNGPVISLGRWAKYPSQRRYKIAEIQATEHDHPSLCVKDKPANRFYGEQRVGLEHGFHGNIYVHDAANGEISIIEDVRFTSEEMREASHLLAQIAEYMESLERSS